MRIPTLGLNTAKLLFNSVVYTPGSRYMCCNIKISTWELLCPDVIESSGYRMVATEAPSVHSGSVDLLYRVAEHFFVEALQN